MGKLRLDITVFCVLFFVTFQQAMAQGFLRTEGTSIVDGNGEPIILRGIGTGNWMLMEGYMMKTEGVAGTQHEIRSRLIELMGEDKTNEFFDLWLENHMTKADVDSMKAWGFNSIRVAMHYKWFTLPVEEETNPGSQTWLLKGFKMIDNLLSWCAENEMYLILDLHGAPGGQGKNADISDYDPSKPSLWESEANQTKTVALWRKLAERYSNHKWIGGYDLINETNWTFNEPDNKPLRDLLERITEAIREVDKNHIIFVEGNSYANDFSGLTPPWDENMVYSFHRYWAGTAYGDLDFVKWIREEHNVPLWMGESGENSNTWFTEFISTCEKNNMGWSWWPVKKNGINNVLFVEVPKRYDDLVKYWRGEITQKPSAAETFQAVKEWANAHKIANCRVQYDVIDAMIRQPHSDEVIPFKTLKSGEPVFFSDYDLGKNGFAYFDTDVANYGGEFKAWNTGWELRNDGVDIQNCSDPGEVTNGFNVGWTENGEWMQYTLNVDSTALYTMKVRHASGSAGSKFRLEINGAKLTESFSLPGTGGWQNWNTATFAGLLLPKGRVQLKFFFEKGGSNLSFFELTDPQSADGVEMNALAAFTSEQGKEVIIVVNRDITNSENEVGVSDFELLIDGIPVDIQSIEIDTTTSNRLILHLSEFIHSDNTIKLSYTGTSVKSNNKLLQPFSDYWVENRTPYTHLLPGKIEAEDFEVNNGLALEDCSDVNGGKNIGYASAGDYLDYRVRVSRTGYYNLNYRVATQHSDAELIFLVGDGINFTALDTISFESTGGWQNWESQSRLVRLEAGYQFIRLEVKQGEQNLNWFELEFVTSSPIQFEESSVRIWPNPASDQVAIDLGVGGIEEKRISLFTMGGNIIKNISIRQAGSYNLELRDIKAGCYLLTISDKNGSRFSKLIVIQ